MRGRARRRPLVALLAGALLASACGARWTDDQRASVESRGSGGEVEAAASGGAAGGSGAAAASAGGGATSSGGSGGAATHTGGSTSAAGGGSGAAAEAQALAGELPCAAPSDAPGVSDSTIRIANISSLSGPVPGLGAAAQAATRAYVARLNAEGGVCGRTVELQEVDDAFDGARYRSIAQELAPSVLGFVGGMAQGDGAGADIVAANGIPVTGLALAQVFQELPNVFDINPPFGDTSGSSAKYRYFYEQGVRTAALVYISAEGSANQVIRTERPLMQAAGIEIVHEQSVPITTLSWDSAARAVANSQADYLLFVGGYDMNSNMARSMHDTGYEPMFEDYVSAYGTNFIDLAGVAGEGTISWAFAIPSEEAAGHPEGAQFLDWLGTVAPDVRPDTFAAQGWSSAKAFFDAVEQVPGPITRQGIVEQLGTFHDFDAGGFYGRLDLGGDTWLGCQVGMRVVGGAWQRFVPADGFLC